MSFIGIDVGTSGCKAAVVEEKGRIRGMGYGHYPLIFPGPGLVELNPEDIWRGVVKALNEIAPLCRDTTALAVASIGETAFFFDRFDKSLINGATYLDGRCSTREADIILDRVSEERLYALSGMPYDPMYTLPKLVWMQEHMPHILLATEKIMMAADFIAYRLTGVLRTDPSSASRTMLMDARRRAWSDEITKAFDIPLEKLPEIVATGSLISKISDRASIETGLPKGLNVYMGCHDQCAAVLGSGVCTLGEIMMSQGSTESINLLIRDEMFSNEMRKARVSVEPFVAKGQYMASVGQLAYGASINWAAGLLKGDGEELNQAVERLDILAEQEQTSAYFLPGHCGYGGNGGHDGNGGHGGDGGDGGHGGDGGYAKGVFDGIDISMSKGQFYRVVLEGLCFLSKILFERIKPFRQLPGALRVTGGCANSRVLMQMKSDILEEEICVVSRRQGVILGLAMICGVAQGVYPDYVAAAEALGVSIETRYCPGKDSEGYAKRFLRFQELWQARSCRKGVASKELQERSRK